VKRTILGILAATSILATPTGAQTNEQSGLSGNLSAFEGDNARANWQAEVEQTERGFRIGNPDAEVSLIEFISYTCGHCATFALEGEGALDLAFLAPGHMTVEVLPVMRNPIDVTVSMLVACGGPEDFKDRHRMFMTQQETWMAKVSSAPQSQKEGWSRMDAASRISMASALDFDDMLANRGVSRMDITTCLSDDAAAAELIENAFANVTEFGVTGTPSFALDDELLTNVHAWSTLYPALAERFRPENMSE